MAEIVERDLGHQAPRDEPAVAAEEQALVDIDMELGRRADLEGMDAMRLRHPGLAVHVEMDDAFRARELGHQHAALDCIGALAACERGVM